MGDCAAELSAQRKLSAFVSDLTDTGASSFWRPSSTFRQRPHGFSPLKVLIIAVVREPSRAKSLSIPAQAMVCKIAQCPPPTENMASAIRGNPIARISFRWRAIIGSLLLESASGVESFPDKPFLSRLSPLELLLGRFGDENRDGARRDIITLCMHGEFLSFIGNVEGRRQ